MGLFTAEKSILEIISPAIYSFISRDLFYGSTTRLKNITSLLLLKSLMINNMLILDSVIRRKFPVLLASFYRMAVVWTLSY